MEIDVVILVFIDLRMTFQPKIVFLAFTFFALSRKIYAGFSSPPPTILLEPLSPLFTSKRVFDCFSCKMFKIHLLPFTSLSEFVFRLAYS